MLWAALGLTFLAGVLLVGCWYCYRLVFYNANLTEQDPYVIPPGKQHEKTAEKILSLIHRMDLLPYEQINITSHDGIPLAARYYHLRDGAPLQIQFHGYHSCALRDMCGVGLMARDMGFNVLMVDQRAHGKSGGHALSFGINERLDCLDWVMEAQKRFGQDCKILLMGISMGAATVLMASDLELPRQVAGVIADCPYSSPKAIIQHIMHGMKLPVGAIYPFIHMGGRIFGGIRLNSASAVSSAKHSKLPILLIHGEEDRFVPCEMSRKIQQASGCTLVTFPEAGHALCYVIDPERYRRVVSDFTHDCGIT